MLKVVELPPSRVTDKNGLKLYKYITKRNSLWTELESFGKHLNNLKYVELDDKKVLDLKSRLQNMKELYGRFHRFQDIIEGLVNDENVIKEQEIRKDFESQYNEYMAESASIKKIAKEDLSNIDQEIDLTSIVLPVFDGSFDNWIEFKEKYVSLIHESNKISQLQKFQFLRSSLSGSALNMIELLEVTSENYGTAWGLITKQYDSPKHLIDSHVKKLFSLPSLIDPSSSQIKELVDTIMKSLQSLNELGEPTDHWDTLMISLVINKLDPATIAAWEIRKSFIGSNKFKLYHLLEFLMDRANIMDSYAANTSDIAIPGPSYQLEAPQFDQLSCNNTQSFDKEVQTICCVMCNDSHDLPFCKDFFMMSPEKRLIFVKSKQLCRNCLGLRHKLSKCNHPYCRVCDRKHHILIHIENYKNIKGNLSVEAASQASADGDAKIAMLELFRILFLMYKKNNS